MSFLRRGLKERRNVGAFGLGLGWPTGTYSSFNPARIPRNGELAAGSSPVLVTEETALALSAIAACVSLIADSVSMLPLDENEKHGKIREVIEPPSPLVADTFGDGNPQQGFYEAVYSLLMRGNWYSMINRDEVLGVPGTGPVISLSKPIHPSTVEVKINPETKQVEYKVNREPVDTRNILHVRAFSVPGMLTGLGPLDYARETIGLGLAQQESAARFFAQDATPPFVIETDADLTEEQAEKLLKRWRLKHEGVFRSHSPGLLDNGAKIQTLAITPENAQFLESRKFQVAEAARLFRVWPWMIGDMERTTSWGTGIEYQGTSFVRYTLAAWTTRIERALSRLLAPPRYARFNVDALQRADSLARSEFYERARNASWLNPDEIRALEDLDPIPGGRGQDYYAPLNYAPLGQPASIPKQGGQSDGQGAA